MASSIDYADQDLVIFHDYWGLIVYDLRQEQIVRALDTSSIGMNLTQGEPYTEVKVGKDLDQILFYISSRENPEDPVYRYDLASDQVWKTTVGEIANLETVPESKQKIKNPTGMGDLFGPWSGYVTEDEEKIVYLTFPKNNEGLTMKELVIWVENETHAVFDTTPDWQWPVQTEATIARAFPSELQPEGENGVELLMNLGSEVYASADGVVAYVDRNMEDKSQGLILQHTSGFFTSYWGLNTIDVKAGNRVNAGARVGNMGDRAILRLEVTRRVGTTAEYYDPMALLRDRDFSKKQTLELTLDLSTDWLWPLEGQNTITSTFGPRIHPITGRTGSHDGTDIAAPEGTSVGAARGGLVSAATFDTQRGNYIEIDHGDGVSPPQKASPPSKECWRRCRYGWTFHPLRHPGQFLFSHLAHSHPKM